MFKVIVTHTNHLTGVTTTRTEPQRYKTRRNAEKAAQMLGYVCSPDGNTVTLTVDAQVVEVDHE